MNKQYKATGAFRALVAYESTTPEALAESYREIGAYISDLIVDLHHLADINGANWSEILARAARFYAEDQEGES